LWFTVVIICMFGSILFGNQDATSAKLTPPETTIRHARENLPKCIDTEDKKVTDLAHSLYEKCLFDKLWEPKLPGILNILDNAPSRKTLILADCTRFRTAVKGVFARGTHF